MRYHSSGGGGGGGAGRTGLRGAGLTEGGAGAGLVHPVCGSWDTALIRRSSRLSVRRVFAWLRPEKNIHTDMSQVRKAAGGNTKRSAHAAMKTRNDPTIMVFPPAESCVAVRIVPHLEEVV